MGYWDHWVLLAFWLIRHDTAVTAGPPVPAGEPTEEGREEVLWRGAPRLVVNYTFALAVLHALEGVRQPGAFVPGLTSSGGAALWR